MSNIVYLLSCNFYGWMMSKYNKYQNCIQKQENIALL
jgi:hypothetical protein